MAQPRRAGPVLWDLVKHIIHLLRHALAKKMSTFFHTLAHFNYVLEKHSTQILFSKEE